MSAPISDPKRAQRLALAIIILIAAGLRLWDLRTAPPGLHQDEASNAWNAYCVLKTGQDQMGQPWPIFHTRGLGENRSTLFLYWMMPFQAVGGLGVWTTRLPSAVAGILTVLLLYYAVSRTVSSPAGLIAAALLALSPWHIQHTRWGHEASLGPFAIAAALALCVWARLPFFRFPDSNETQPRPIRALIGGLLIGVLCYGYPAIRLFAPVFLLAACACMLPAWLRMLRTRRGVLACAGLAGGLAVTFGPLAYQHIVNAKVINKRGDSTMIWQPDAPLSERLSKIADRYVEHWGPKFLFTEGDNFEPYSPPVGGELPWYMLPLLLAGAAAAVRMWRSEPFARIALVGAILYPAADVCFWNDGPSVLRSFPGLIPLTMLAAFGAAYWGVWWWRNRRIYAELYGAWVLLEAAWFAFSFFGEFNRRERVYHGYQQDLVAAAEWLAPRTKEVDGVFWPMDERFFNMPYIVVVVASGYDPAQWQRERLAGEIDIQELHPWDYCFRYGKMYFRYPAASDRILGGVRYLKEMRTDDRRQKLLFVARPEEFPTRKPIHEIRDAQGVVQLVIFELEL